MMLHAALRQKLPWRLKAGQKLHSQMQESSKMICNLPAVKRRFAQKCVLRLVAKWKLHSQTQENSKIICNLLATPRRFAQKSVLRLKVG